MLTIFANTLMRASLFNPPKPDGYATRKPRNPMFPADRKTVNGGVQR
ncbi:hypothetical protein [Tranquillimonas rosea]